MSTGLECEMIEEAEGVWWYMLEQGSAPKNAWDWREYADLYGPHVSYEAACEHLRANHANPGGHGVTERANFTPDANFERLKAEAVERGLADRRRPTYRW